MRTGPARTVKGSGRMSARHMRLLYQAGGAVLKLTLTYDVCGGEHGKEKLPPGINKIHQITSSVCFIQT